MKEHDYCHRHSDPYGRESEDVQRGIATVTPGTAFYRGGSWTRAITTGTATYMGGSQAMRCHHRHSGLEGREPKQKSARPDSRTGSTAGVLNLGYAYPQGYVRGILGVRDRFLKILQF